MAQKTFSVKGMSCSGCAASVESILKSRQGVLNAGVNFAEKTVTVEYLQERITPKDMQEAVHDIGYELGNEVLRDKQDQPI